ncbi:tRNA pseudouridine synthase A [Corynebacterium oculi]|uniref:tRNA pseudouridine synthase A n=1 Tax=Corynebacterium oculi TaxID=1544416 RepID=A0A0Q0YDA9_9CORY|nr:tRNA pseudouridine(38-40) synthase TruA [Corynebacterium oculi]KQB84286.1 tRNA pseudouridine synthase A [Corynebacterium oculi]
MTATVRLRLDLAYDGTDFHGWARQKDESLRTVQGAVEDALSLVLRVPVSLTVAGRTDAGVHAAGQVAHADVPAECLNQRSIEGDPGRLVRRLSRLLPEDVRLSSCSLAPEGFDARFSALRRRYLYRVTTAPGGALPTRARDTTAWPKRVDLALMQSTADHLVGLHDFAAFCKAKPHATTVRDLQALRWRDASTPLEPYLYEAEVIADAFCWSMVRALVGCCLAAGEGRFAPETALGLLEERRRSPRVPVAAAKGLSLVGVDYPSDRELAARALVTRDRRAALPSQALGTDTL